MKFSQVRSIVILYRQRFRFAQLIFDFQVLAHVFILYSDFSGSLWKLTLTLTHSHTRRQGGAGQGQQVWGIPKRQGTDVWGFHFSYCIYISISYYIYISHRDLRRWPPPQMLCGHPLFELNIQNMCLNMPKNAHVVKTHMLCGHPLFKLNIHFYVVEYIQLYNYTDT